MTSTSEPKEDSIEKKVSLLMALVRTQQQLLACMLANSADPKQIIDDFRETSAQQHEVLQAKDVQDEDVEAHALARAMMLRDLETLSKSWSE